MKRHTLSIFVIAAIAASCATTNTEKDKKDVISLLQNETDDFAKKDFEKWSGHWSHGPDVLITYTVNNQATIAKGWDELSGAIKNVMPTINEKNQSFSRKYNSVLIDHDLAWVDFTQVDSLDGNPTTKRETRTLKRDSGEWKIISAQIINMTSFEPTPAATVSHLPKEKISTVMAASGTIIRMQPGWGGMAVLYNDIPVGMDFAPLLQGLKDNSCQVPHWAYLVDGTMKLNYSDGKQEVINAGEVFYMRPGHVPIIEKNVRLLEFSPEKEMKQLFAHMGKRMEELKKEQPQSKK